jgi:hypothetical protein
MFTGADIEAAVSTFEPTGPACTMRASSWTSVRTCRLEGSRRVIVWNKLTWHSRRSDPMHQIELRVRGTWSFSIWRTLCKSVSPMVYGAHQSLRANPDGV